MRKVTRKKVADNFDDEEYEEVEEEISPKDIDQIHIMFLSIIESLIQQKAMQEEKLDEIKNELDGSLDKGNLRNLMISHKMRFFLDYNDSLRLINMQLIRKYKEYLAKLKNYAGGSDNKNLYELIETLETNNAKLEQNISLGQDNIKSNVLLEEENNMLIEEIIFLIGDKRVAKKRPQSKAQAIKTVVKYGRRCTICGTSLRGTDKNKVYCKTCAEKRQREAKREWARRNKKKKNG